MQSFPKQGSRLPLPVANRRPPTAGDNPTGGTRFGLLSFKPSAKKSKDTSLLGLKRSANTSVGKEPRPRVGPLATMERPRPYPAIYVSNAEEDADELSGELPTEMDIAARLDFDMTEANFSQLIGVTPAKTFKVADEDNDMSVSQMFRGTPARTVSTVEDEERPRPVFDDPKYNVTSLINFASPDVRPNQENEPVVSLPDKTTSSPLAGSSFFSPLPLQPQNPPATTPGESRATSFSMDKLISLSPTPNKPVEKLEKTLSTSKLSVLFSPANMSKSTSPFMKWDAISKEAELVEAKTQVSKLEGQLEEMDFHYQESKIEFEKEVDKLNSQISQDKELQLELEQQIKFHQQNEEQAFNQLNIARDEFAEEQEKMQKQINDLQKEVGELKVWLSDARFENESIQKSHSNEVLNLNNQIQSLQNEVIQTLQEKEVLVKRSEQLYLEAKNAEELSQELANAKNEVLHLNEELKAYADGVKLSQILQDELQELRNYKVENEKWKQEYEARLEMEKEEKEREFNVIHLNDNPLSNSYREQAEEMKRLIEENQRLKAQVEILESGNDANITRQIEEGIKNSQENEKLKEELATAEKRQKQIMAAFKKTSKEFREVCYFLTGYRVDALKQRIYRFSHVYADSPNDFLLFELENNGTLKLLENDYSKKLSDLVQTYLTQHDSFPAFLASLTLDLFQKQTHYVEPSLL